MRSTPAAVEQMPVTFHTRVRRPRRGAAAVDAAASRLDAYMNRCEPYPPRESFARDIKTLVLHVRGA